MGTRLGEGRKTNVGKLHVYYNAQSNMNVAFVLQSLLCF